MQDYVAPDILNIELSHASRAITSTVGLTGMTVNGSCVSPEVNEMYEKDEVRYAHILFCLCYSYS